MSRLFKGMLVALVALSFAAPALAGSQGTKDEAAAMVKKAVAFAKANGKEKLLSAVVSKEGPFIDRDLYISVWDPKAKVLAHGANPAMVGKDVGGLKDADGKPFMQEIMSKAQSNGSGWVDYKWENPASKEIQEKSAYFERVDDMIISTGYYKK